VPTLDALGLGVLVVALMACVAWRKRGFKLPPLFCLSLELELEFLLCNFPASITGFATSNYPLPRFGGKAMDGLTEGIDLTPFVGRQLGAARFGVVVIAFLFDGSEVVVESDIALTSADGSSKVISDFRASATDLCQLVGQEVIGAERTPNGGLLMQMSSGMSVEFRNSNTRHESFQLNIGNKIFVA
jgi:hypothetical protein